jgi:hypothetical protein
MGTTLTDHLRALPDDGLAALLALRPDLVVPVPADLSALAARAQTRVSAARALDPLDRFTLEVLEAVRLSREEGGTSLPAVLALTAAARTVPAALVRTALDRLRARFLIFGPEEDLRIAAGVDEVCSPYAAGLGRPAAELDPVVAAVCADPAGLRRTVLAAPPSSRAVLDRLAAGPPLGTVTSAAARDPESPVGWLIAHHLLASGFGAQRAADATMADGATGVPLPAGSVELPREVGLLLRREVGPLGELHPQAPTLADAPLRAAAQVDSAGAGQTLEAVRQTEVLLEAISAEPVSMLRAGGVGVRELRRLARTAGIDETQAGLLIEVANGAGLIAEAEPDSSGEVRFLPTVAYDGWRAIALAERWVRLAGAWLTLTRQPGLIGRRDERDRPLNALAPELERIGAPQVRFAALNALAALPPGTAPAEEDVLGLLAWQAPRQFSTGRNDQVRATLTEAAVLGVTGLGAMTGYGRLLVRELLDAAANGPDEDPLGVRAGDAAHSPPVQALNALLPAPVDHILVQADLTAVVPGPPEPGLAAELDVVADAESTNLYRLTADSVRRALDTGYAASDLHALFARRSRTPVPQALTYLIDDVARRHGGLRVGTASSYLRSDDEALLLELAADRRVAGLHLRRLAPTVLTSPYPSSRVLPVLREAGYAPVPEDAVGAAMLSRPRARRAPVRRTPVTMRSIVDGQVHPSAARLGGIVEQLRRTDAASRVARRAPVEVRSVRGSAGPGAQAHAHALAVLQQAVRDKQRVWVGYVDAHGGTNSRLVRPVSIGAGYLRAEDDRTETLHTFALHRITAAVPDDEDDPA